MQFFENHAKHISIMTEQNAELLIVIKQTVHIVTTDF
jgi:hypothetical protein